MLTGICIGIVIGFIAAMVIAVHSVSRPVPASFQPHAPEPFDPGGEL